MEWGGGFTAKDINIEEIKLEFIEKRQLILKPNINKKQAESKQNLISLGGKT